MRLIDADALKKSLEKLWNIHDDQDFANKDVWREIENAPTIEPEREKGEWIIRYYDMESYQIKEVEYNPLFFNNPCGITYCSKCGAHPLLNGHEEYVYSKYCPHCGAEMTGNE